MHKAKQFPKASLFLPHFASKMEILHPHPPRITPFSEFSHPVTLGNGFNRESVTVISDESQEIIGDDDYEVYVAVGKSSAKAITVLRWAFRCFPGRGICILHVHQPSSLIPTLLGKLPASEASHEVVSAYRMEETEKTNRLLLNYLSVCCESKIRARILTIEAAQVQKGILDLVNEHGIRKLVIGAMPDSCVKVKRSSNKASHAAKYAPHFCQIWFIYKGKHVWTKASTEKALSTISFPTHLSSSAPEYCSNSSSSTTTNSVSRSNSCTEQRLPLDSTSKYEEERLYGHLIEITLKVEALRMEASVEISKREHLEAEAAKSIEKVTDLESACECESKLTNEAENEVKDTIQKQGKLLEKQEEITKKLHKTTQSITVLESLVQEANRRREQAASELKFLETSIATMQREKRRIQRQKAETMRWIDSRKNNVGTNSWFAGFAGDSFNLAEFSFADLQTATCNFSESFRIGQGGNGCVYKGEMLDRTVAIKMWDPRNIQRQLEFQQEVQILGKLRHSHLATLIGICPEACSVVYDYLPNGSLQNFLLRKSNKASITWKLIARIIAEISSALLFLHSCKPKSVVHGNLKPENILLDSELSCKLCDLGICTSLGQYDEPSGAAFSHTDPEFHRTGVLTMKSDIYSFGLIILQLLTGKSSVGLVNEVRRAVSTGKLVSILDMSAGEWPTFVSRRLVDLGLQFCKINSKERPLLTSELVKELQNLPFSEDRPVPSFFLCPIVKEIMYDPQVVADGFTYEGEAIRTWLKNGHETSPMTNLKLDHLHVTPNHSIRNAIQDWLRKP